MSKKNALLFIPSVFQKSTCTYSFFKLGLCPMLPKLHVYMCVYHGEARSSGTGC